MNIYEKIAAIRDEAAWFKDKTIETKGGAYDIWTEVAVLSVLRPLLVKHDLVAWRTDIKTVFASANTTQIVSHMKLLDLGTGETLEFAGIGGGYDKSDKSAGKASTYSVKDAFLKLFQATTGLDPDRDSSDETDESVRASGVELLDRLWNLRYFHKRSASLGNIEIESPQAEALAKTEYQQHLDTIKTASLDQVTSDNQAMQKIVKNMEG